jgi:hypothetical protein
MHGVLLPDSYRWLEDTLSFEGRTWVAAQEAYAANVLARVVNRDSLARLYGFGVSTDRMSGPYEQVWASLGGAPPRPTTWFLRASPFPLSCSTARTTTTTSASEMLVAKFVARLQAENSGDRPVVWVRASGGHRWLASLSPEWAATVASFLLWQTGAPRFQPPTPPVKTP